MKIVRLKLSGDQLNPRGLRYDGTGDTVQSEVNGTWVDNPTADPRTADGYVYPPLVTDDPRCDAAANMTEAIFHIVSEATARTTLVAMASAVLALLTAVFPPLAIFDPLVIALCDLIIGIGTIVVSGAFTETARGDILCFFFNVLDANGQLDAAGLEAVRTQITASEDATVAGVCDAIFAIVGWVGVNNWGSSGTQTGDCAACDECTYSDDMATGLGEKTTLVPPAPVAAHDDRQGGEWTSDLGGQPCVRETVDNYGDHSAEVFVDFGQDCAIALIGYNRHDGGNFGITIVDDAGDIVFNNVVGSGTGWQTGSMTPGVTGRYVRFATSGINSAVGAFAISP